MGHMRHALLKKETADRLHAILTPMIYNVLIFTCSSCFDEPSSLKRS